MAMHRRRRFQDGDFVGGLIMVGIGTYFLLREFGYLWPLHKFWPVILIIIGIALIAGSIRSGGRRPGAGFPDSHDLPPPAEPK